MDDRTMLELSELLPVGVGIAALSLPNLATPILNKIKAESYREAAMHCSKHGSRTADEVSEDLFAKADELEQSK